MRRVGPTHVRTAMSTVATWEGETFRLDKYLSKSNLIFRADMAQDGF